MSLTGPYDDDLAYIHDQGFGGFARGVSPGLLQYLRQAGIHQGLIIDLGCGSGIWARELVDAGYDVLGVDISPAMIALARRRVPEAKLVVASFVSVPFPPCRAVTAIGEVFNYLFDPNHSLPTLRAVCQRVYDALAPGGLLIFDVAGPGRCAGRTQAFTEGADWTCLVEYRQDEENRRLARRIVTFRKINDGYRRREELHCQQLFAEADITSLLEQIGFRVRATHGYGEYRLPENVVAFIAQKP